MLTKIIAKTINAYKFATFHKRQPNHIYKPPQQPRQWSKFQQTQYNSYFQNKYPEMKPPCKSIIQQLGKKQSNPTAILKSLQKYLDLANVYQTKTSLQLISLLVAFNMNGNYKFAPYRKHIIQFLLRLDLYQLKLDSRSILVFIDTMQYVQSGYMQKIKSYSMKYIIMNTIRNHFDIISLDYYPRILKIIHKESIDYVFNSYRFVHVADQMQEKMDFIFKKVLASAGIQDKYRKIFTDQYMLQITEIHNIYGSKNEQFTINLYRILTEHFIDLKLTNFSGIISINQIYRHFPTSTMHPTSGKTLKTMLLQFISSKYLTTKYQSIINNKNSSHLCYSILTHYFAEHANMLEYQIEGDVRFVTKQELQKKGVPELPYIFWKMYKNYPTFINYLSILNNTIKDCYSSQYIATTEAKSDPYVPTKETQIKIRVHQALKQMGIQFIEESFISGRFVDFLLPNNIVLQIDGAHHFSPRKLSFEDNTQFRNLHLLIAGYKIISLNIYEYNNNRQLEDLKHLLTNKLKVMNQKDGVLVL